MSTTIFPLKPYYIAGSNVTLSCLIIEPYFDISTTVYIKWISNRTLSNEFFIHSYNTFFNHTLHDIKLSEAGNYDCIYYITSAAGNSYIIDSDDRVNFTNVTVKSECLLNSKLYVMNVSFLVPNGNNPSITNMNSYYNVSANIVLLCSVAYPNSSFIDVDTNVNIQWLNSSNHTLHSYTGLNDYTEHTLNYTISNVKLSDAGQYTCQYNVSSNNSFVITSDVMRAVTNVSVQSKSILCRL